MNETPTPKPIWRIARYLLIVLAFIATLTAVFYTEEDWRGKRAWEQCKAQLESQGIVLDWNKFIPRPIPDDQNFYTASTNILLRFSQLREEDTNAIEAVKQLPWLKLTPLLSNGVPVFPGLDTSKTKAIMVATIIISPQKLLFGPDSNTLIASFGDPAAPKSVRNFIQSTVGKTIQGAQGFYFSQFLLNNPPPAQIYLQAGHPPSASDLAAFIPDVMIGERGRLQLVSMVDPHVFRVELSRNIQITSAADYLAWSDQFVPAFDEIREALKRPYAIIPGDYSVPYQMPIPNFVTMRALAQTLAQRAQCYLLLGEPDKALHEMTLIHDVCRILEKPPTGQPETLVEAMINVAIHGLYVQIIAEGMKRHEWQEPQLEAFQEQLAQINLPPIVKNSFDMETAAQARTIETISYSKLREINSVFSNVNKTDPWQMIDSFFSVLKSALLPRGWIYQNMVTDANLMSRQAAGFDSDGIIQPDKFENIDHALRHIPTRYKLFANIMIPNFTKAWQTTAYNQTMVNEAQIACALERCHLVHGDYPDSLDALTPGYLATIPSDLIGGQPLHYHRTNDGAFLLYSVGWNERDDGGKQSPKSKNGYNNDFTRGDWVWPATEK